MRAILLIGVLALIPGIICPPVEMNQQKAEEKVVEGDKDNTEDVNLGLEYERYLKEIVSVLESDDEFRKRVEESNTTDIQPAKLIEHLAYERYIKEVFSLLMTDPKFVSKVIELNETMPQTGEIAKHLQFVSHGVRSKLDEIKRNELERLRAIQRLRIQQQRGGRDMMDPLKLVAHLDHSNPGSFGEADLAKLISQATTDLEIIDKTRRQDFKKYEMEKEHEYRQKLETIKDEKARLELKKEHEENMKKHKNHPKMHHPGSKDQLEEVWEEGDGLDKEDFDPRTFFLLHDANSDGVLDEEEVEALFQKELDKVYDPNASEDDMNERFEEMNRMREHVFTEIDKDQDKMITLDEFIASTKEEDFDKDEGWKTLDEEEIFTDEELAKFEREYEEQRRAAYENEQAQPGEINVPPVLSDREIAEQQVQQINLMEQGIPVQAPDDHKQLKFRAGGENQAIHPAMMHREEGRQMMAENMERRNQELNLGDSQAPDGNKQPINKPPPLARQGNQANIDIQHESNQEAQQQQEQQQQRHPQRQQQGGNAPQQQGHAPEKNKQVNAPQQQQQQQVQDQPQAVNLEPPK